MHAPPNYSQSWKSKMGLNNMVVVLKVSVLLLFLFGVATARLDMSYLKGDDLYEPTKMKACCDSCICNKKMPPDCHCKDVRLNSCHSACNACACTRSIPAYCSCHDTTNFCYPPCKGSEDEDH